jgi:hypothetical protein
MWDGADKKQHIPNVQSVIAVLKQFILLLHPQIRKKWQYANLSTTLLLHRHHRFLLLVLLVSTMLIVIIITTIIQAA